MFTISFFFHKYYILYILHSIYTSTAWLLQDILYKEDQQTKPFKMCLCSQKWRRLVCIGLAQSKRMTCNKARDICESVVVVSLVFVVWFLAMVNHLFAVRPGYIQKQNFSHLPSFNVKKDLSSICFSFRIESLSLDSFFL